MHQYGDDFYAFLSSFAVRSAEQIVPLVLAAGGAASVADFGCGHGAWLSVWRVAGLQVQGIDGPYVERAKLLIPDANFTPADLAAPISLGRRFDIVQSLETAEHLPGARAAGFVADLTAHADRVLFSAAVPGQGGEHHVNEQTLEYWRALFRAHDYLPVDLVRPQVRNIQSVQAWYRCNTILYVKRQAMPLLSPAARAYLVEDQIKLDEYWPWQARLQQTLIRQLPLQAVDFLSRVQARRYKRAAQAV